jgi:hypothetical protein
MMAEDVQSTETGMRGGWPTPDDPAYANAGEQTRQWLEATQPEALATSLTETIRHAFDGLSCLALFDSCYPREALDNAAAQLPPARAEVFKRQLAFARKYAEENQATRGSEGHLEESLFALTMQALEARDLD